VEEEGELRGVEDREEPVGAGGRLWRGVKRRRSKRWKALIWVEELTDNRDCRCPQEGSVRQA
jgi:hypothetical protein